MIESGLISLLRTTAIIVVVYYVIKFILSKIINVSGRTTNSSFKNNTKSKSAHKDDKLGDYVEYEDLSD